MKPSSPQPPDPPQSIPETPVTAIWELATRFAANLLDDGMTDPPLPDQITATLRQLSSHLGMDRALFGRWIWPEGRPADCWSAGGDCASLAALATEWLASNQGRWPERLLAHSRDDLSRSLPSLAINQLDAGIDCAVVIPVSDGGDRLALIAAAGPTPRPPGSLTPCAGPILLLASVIALALRRRDIEDMLGSAVRHWHSTIDAIQEVIVLVDLDGRVLRGNRALADWLGRSNKELIGQPVLDSLYRGGPGAAEAMARLLAARERQTFDLSMEGRDWRVTLDPMLDAAGELSGIVHILSDVTEQRRLERQVSASERMKMIGRLASGVAHEVRNPLNAITSLTEALLQEVDPNAEQAKFLNMIGAQVARLAALMRDLLDLGKPIPADCMQPESLRLVCTAAIELWKGGKQPHPQSLQFITQPEAGNLTVMADSARLQQVVLNLLDNAAQHSPAESEIVMTLEPMDMNGGPAARLRIKDAGSGIPEENLPRVFEPFMTTRRQGTGLGLSLVRNIVENHQGRVEIFNNTPAPGCTVEVRLPAAAAEDFS